jgi:GDP-D-mannose dehydratase
MITKFEKFDFDDDDFGYDDQKKYWKVKTEAPYLELSLNALKDKYGCTLEMKDFEDEFVRSDGTLSFVSAKYTTEYVYIGSINLEEKIWNWAEDTQFFNMNSTKFMGEVKIPKKYWNEYKIKKLSNKYNF